MYTHICKYTNTIITDKYSLNKMQKGDRGFQRNQVFWISAAFGWVTSSRRFEQMYLIHPKGYEFIHGHTNPKVKTVHTFECREETPQPHEERSHRK